MTHDYGRFVWHELITTEAKQAIAFYPELLGWKVQEMDMPGGIKYPMIQLAGQGIGGIVPPPKPGIPPHWVGYVSVASVDDTAKLVKKYGGTLLMDAFDVPGVGRMQPVADPEGSALFLFHSASEDGPAPTGPGSFHWDELWAQDTQKMLTFYESVFGYSHDTMKMPNGDYHVLKNGDAMRGGLLKAPSTDIPSHWAQYVAVDDCDAAIKRATQSGGKPVGEVMEVDGVGRFGFIEDPSGATLGLIKPARA